MCTWIGERLALKGGQFYVCGVSGTSFCSAHQREGEGRWAICKSTGSYLSIVLLGEGLEGACNSSGGLDRVKLGGEGGREQAQPAEKTEAGPDQEQAGMVHGQRGGGREV